MKNTIIGFLVAGALIAAPFAASAQSVDLQTQINGLLEQIKTLQFKIADLLKQQVASSTATTIAPAPSMRVCTLLNRNLSQGSTGDDVSGLQEFLNTKGFLSATATGFFGPMTAQAVAKWQTSEGVSSVGAVGPASRERISIWCGNPNPSPSQNFSALPTSGDAPLDVTFTTSVGIGDIDSSIDFGDGQQGTMTRGSCIGIAAIVGGQGGIRCSDTSTHTYSTNGTYTATLSSRIDMCKGAVGCMSPMSIRLLGKVQITVGGTSTICKPITYMPILCDGGTPAQPVHDSNGCLIKYECPVVNFTPPASCKTWNDGCNTCSRTSPDASAACTMRACLMTTVVGSTSGATQSIWAGKGYCIAYFEATSTPITSNKPPAISSFSGPTTLALNTAGTWSVGASDPQNGQLSYQITWGDESNLVSAQAANMPMIPAPFVQSTTFTHAYSSAGIYNVKVNVSGSGGISSASATVQVGSAIACTTEYAPVCGQPAEPACRHAVPACMIATPGPTTYSNRCVMNAAGATFVSEGACVPTYNY